MAGRVIRGRKGSWKGTKSRTTGRTKLTGPVKDLKKGERFFRGTNGNDYVVIGKSTDETIVAPYGGSGAIKQSQIKVLKNNIKVHPVGSAKRRIMK